MNVTFYFDPCCPFCWITSRWLLLVQNQRHLKVDWQPFSLALKNDELAATADSKHATTHRAAHRVLRVIVAAQEKTGASLIDLYTEFGKPFHLLDRPYDDTLISQILAEQNLPADLLAAADDAQYDARLSGSIKAATAVAGDDIGVPTIVFTADDGSKSGFFGPVLQELPSEEAALKLWDGLSQLATDKNFYELKRSRPDGQPDVFSTARC
jgi:hypothetical protein